MTFEDAYRRFFEVIVKYCYARNGENKYYAEEAASKAFYVLYNKWNSLTS